MSPVTEPGLDDPAITLPLSYTSDPAQQTYSARSSLADSSGWTWHQVTSRAITDVPTLAHLLDISEPALTGMTEDNALGPRIPHTFVACMQRGNINDPLLLQVLNRGEEQQSHEGYSNDPLQEHSGSPCPGLIHKYPGRVLLTIASACPINCRYCFRQHFPYDQNRLTPATWEPALDYIRNDSSIREIILSGGEPLMMKDALLGTLLGEIETIEHVQLIRIHTRFPVAVPQRMTDSLVQRLRDVRVPVTMVLHTNHSNEIDATVVSALSKLRESSVTLLNQSVLSKGINDCSDTLNTLSRKLFAAGVLPYYLHVLDTINGAAHFAIADTNAKQLHQTLIDQLPGYLVPTLVREVPGQPAKTRL